MANLTCRQRLALVAALNYAYANADDLNDGLAFDVPDDGDPDQVEVEGLVITAFVADEFLALKTVVLSHEGVG